MSSDAGVRRVLFVCTANICRSPTAEYLARSRYPAAFWQFRSAGFLETGRSSSGELIQVLDEAGIDVRTHRSFKVNQASTAAADLILTMQGDHVQGITSLDPAAYPKTLPLKEAADLLEGRPHDAPAVPIDQLLEFVGQQRQPASYLDTTWDVADPYGRSIRHYRRAVGEIDELLDAVMTRIG